MRQAGASGYRQTVVTINQFGLQERTRVSPTGKESVRYTVAITGTPLPHDLSPRELGRRPAAAMADWLRNRVRTIQASAAEATVARRQQAVKSFEAGMPDAMARYAGGRMGAMAPNQSSKLFNDSGRFAAGITALPRGEDGRPSAGEWTINVPANRWDPRTLTGPEGRSGLAALQEIYAKLVKLVPEFADPHKLVNAPSVRRAIEESAASIVRQNADLRTKLGRARMNVLRTVLDTGWQLAQMA